MSNSIKSVKRLAESHGLQFKDCGNGHVQISGHGILMNYWPNSRKRTVWFADGEKHTYVGEWDAVKLCLTKAKPRMKPKKPSQNGPHPELLNTVTTNPLGLTRFYDDKTAPWDESLGEFQWYSEQDRLNHWLYINAYSV